MVGASISNSPNPSVDSSGFQGNWRIFDVEKKCDSTTKLSSLCQTGGNSLTTVDKWVQDDLNDLLEALPERISTPLKLRADLNNLLEVVIDLGRPPEARFSTQTVIIDPQHVNEADIDWVSSQIGEFGDDNRAGIARTLHRISAIRNRKGKIVGLTCRVGRAVFGTIRIIEDQVLSGKSVLLLGRPGVGKTTMLREVARVLADDANKRVIIVDTSNEIAGDGDIPHPAIGRARRMQVETPSLQHSVMIEAVENHMPEVIIIDEMSTELESQAARTIAERGVQLIATAHGKTLDNLALNPTLADLVGGIQPVTLGDDEARRRGTQKTILERKAPPTFDVLVEIQAWDRVAVHDDIARVMDAWLRGRPIPPETRWLDDTGQVAQEREVSQMTDSRTPAQTAAVGQDARDQQNMERIFLFGLGRDRVERAAREAGLPVRLVSELQSADVVLTTKAHYRRSSGMVRAAEENGKPVYVLRANTAPQVQQFLRARIRAADGDANLEQPLREAGEAAQRVIEGERSVTLMPQQSYIRRLQHLLAARHSLASSSSGKEPQRQVTFFK
jgi:stage III sporulation protein SpoIIIAA